MEENNFSPQQSLALIESMISKTRRNLSENRVYFLFWGWLTFVCILLQFVLKVWLQYQHHYMVWLSVIPAVIIITIYSRRHVKRAAVKTYMGEAMTYLWMGVGISFFILSIIIQHMPGSWMHAWPFFIMFYGLGTFVSGKILQFNPLVIGGVFNWVIAVLCPLVAYDYQLLLAALAVLTSYIIPGHLLRTNKT